MAHTGGHGLPELFFLQQHPDIAPAGGNDNGAGAQVKGGVVDHVAAVGAADQRRLAAGGVTVQADAVALPPEEADLPVANLQLQNGRSLLGNVIALQRRLPDHLALSVPVRQHAFHRLHPAVCVLIGAIRDIQRAVLRLSHLLGVIEAIERFALHAAFQHIVTAQQLKGGFAPVDQHKLPAAAKGRLRRGGKGVTPGHCQHIPAHQRQHQRQRQHGGRDQAKLFFDHCFSHPNALHSRIYRHCPDNAA